MSDLFSNTSLASCSSCTKCSELVKSRTQIVYPTCVSNSQLLVIGEAPGRDEDLSGVGFVGIAGKTLDKLLSEYGIKRSEYSLANICWCRPLENRKPTNVEIDNCLPHLANLIEELKPRVILTVGATPTRVFCGSGNLYDKILERFDSCAADICAHAAHTTIKPVLKHVGYIVPTPHTSPLAFNRNAPSGKKWSVIAKEQIEKVKELLN